MKINLLLFALISLVLLSLSSCGKKQPPREEPVETLPDPEDDFSITQKINPLAAIDAPWNKDFGENNYMRIRYHSQVGIKGTVFYVETGKPDVVYSDDFYLESGTNKSFNIIIGQEENKPLKTRLITHFRFANLENKLGELEVSDINFNTKNLTETQFFLENGNLKIGVDLKWGGALFYLAYKKEKVFQVDHNGEAKIGIDYDKLENAVVTHNGDINLINHHDVGRLVQQSYYGTTQPPYVTGTYLGMQGLPYNPVQGGDQKENESKIIDFNISGNAIYVKCQPRDWAPATGTPSYMENTYVLHEDYLEINNKFTDYSMYIPEIRDQELPAVYTVRNIDNWMLYDGNKPFSGDELTILRAQGNDAANRVVNNNITENWAALVNEQQFGLGIYVPDMQGGILTTFGFSPTITNTNDKEYNKPLSLRNATTYMTFIKRLAFRSFKPVEYISYLTAGRVDAMRSVFYKLKQQGANNQELLGYE